MGHAEHFLLRTGRLDREQEDLALRLYRDPKLVLAVLAEAKLPDGATRVALAIAPGEDPPHILVERDGRFITCLGEGMAVRDALVVPHLRFRELREHVVSLREMFARASEARSALGGSTALIRRLFESGSGLTREEMRTAAAIAPLWATHIIRTITSMRAGIDRLQQELLGWKKRERWTQSAHGREKLRALWCDTWAIGHIAMLVPAVAASHPLPKDALAGATILLHYDAALDAFSPILVRTGWALARLGKPAFDVLEENARNNIVANVMACPFAITALGAAHPHLRERALAWLSSSPNTNRDGSPLEPHMAELREKQLRVFASALNSPEESDGLLLEMGREAIWKRGREEKALRWAAAEHVPDDLARSLCAGAEVDLLGRDLDSARFLAAYVPWLGRAQPDELYLPKSERDVEGFFDGNAFNMLGCMDHLRSSAEEPVRAQAVPGRNDPCACGSGKKYKRCCAS